MNYSPIPRVKGYDYPYISFPHRIDRQAPQLSTLVQGNTRPKIVETYQIAGTNRPNHDTPAKFANLVSFHTQGQPVVAPFARREIGPNQAAIVLHADKNSLVLKYTGEDEIVTGYTFHMENIEVNPGLLAYYQDLNKKGRGQLPVVAPGQELGYAKNDALQVAIRDTGTFMDPRWLEDWWRE